MDLKLINSLLTFILFIVVHEVSAVHVFNVYRMLQFDTLVKDQPPLASGALRASLNSLAVTVNTKLDRLERYVVMVPVEQLTTQLVDDLINKRGADGIVVLLPSDTSTLKSSGWQTVERELSTQKLPAAIYFAYWDDEVRSLYEELNNDELSNSGTNFIGADTYRLVVPPPDPAPIKEVNLVTLQGFLPGSTRTRAEVPTVAIVAYTDSSSAAPGLAYGADSNGSGMVALLELARIFSKLYKNPRTQGEYNLLFLLTGSGRQNFHGSKNWLDKADSRLKNSIDLALCLDTIGSSSPLHLHVSRTDKDPNAKRLFEIFQAAGAEFSIPVEIVHKKINVSNPEIPWEHEQYAMQKLFGATISNIAKAESPLARGDISDKTIDPVALKRNIQMVGEVLSRFIYNLAPTSKISVFSNEYTPSDMYIKSWASTISKYPRMMPHFTHPQSQPPTSTKDKNKDKEENYLLSGLERELSRHLTEVSKKVTKLSNTELEYMFYDRTSAEMSAFRKKPLLFDVLLSILIIIYLSLLYTLLKGPAETIKQIKAIFATSKKKR